MVGDEHKLETLQKYFIFEMVYGILLLKFHEITWIDYAIRCVIQ
jgi:hypothetical protein